MVTPKKRGLQAALSSVWFLYQRLFVKSKTENDQIANQTQSLLGHAQSKTGNVSQEYATPAFKYSSSLDTTSSKSTSSEEAV
ncbi:hypothetical protein RRG08_052254 [Elysia crispata]|uniref:Uncharacterized protein n=1 Tax=Elysia crispata TaxID=231223 RepID=A0AAE0XDX4_9GAST|nr:hypothetical protein RRG08_052254 [Elysia crispata]